MCKKSNNLPIRIAVCLISKYRENQTEEHCENAHPNDNHNPPLADVALLRGGLGDQNHAQQDCSIFVHVKDITFKLQIKISIQ